MPRPSPGADALDILSALVIEDGRRWGEAALPWQWADARAVLDPAATVPYHYLTRGRGGSKSTDLAGIAIAAMMAQAPVGAHLYGLAADRDQGRLLIDSARAFATRTPLLRDVLDVQSFRVAIPARDVVLDILAADAAGAWGLRPWLVIVDELAQWPSTPAARVLWEAVTSAMAKMPGSRMAVLTSAGDPAHWSAKVLDHALSDPLWRVHQVPGPVPWLASERLEEQRRRLPASSYARLYLNQWTASEDRLTSIDDLRACVTLSGPLLPADGTRYAVSLDVGLKRDRTVAAVAHADPLHVIDDITVSGHRVVLDRMETWQGSREAPVQLQEVEEWVAQASEQYGGAEVVVDPWQAVGLAQRLRARGIEVVEFSFTAASVGRLASTLHLLLRDRALALPEDPELLDELEHVRLRETSPGVMRMDHDPDRHDDRAISLALAAVHLLSRPAPGITASISTMPPSGGTVIRRGDLSLHGAHYLDAEPALAPSLAGRSAVSFPADGRGPAATTRRIPPPGWVLATTEGDHR